MILVVDIGGTKVRAGLCEVIDGKIHVRCRERFVTHEWPSFLPLLQQFLANHDSPAIEAVAIGLAGPVTEKKLTLTNLAWVIDTDEIQAALGGATVVIVNDLAAHAYGLPFLAPEQRLTLNPGKPRPGHQALIAAGTGLGECLVCQTGNHILPIPSEGGHCDFSPRNAQEIQLLQFLLQRHPEHVSWERVISGKYGFRNLYDFLRQSTQAENHEVLQSDPEAPDDFGAVVSRAARDGHPLAAQTMQLFMSLYGAEAGNLALKSLPFGGLYIAGGIVRRNIDALKHGEFFAAFIHKGRFERLLSEIPIYVVMEAELPIVGLAAHAAHELGLF